MKRYIFRGEIWGPGIDKFEKEYDTLEECKEESEFFKEFCQSSYIHPKKEKGNYKFTKTDKCWGWVIGDRETEKIIEYKYDGIFGIKDKNSLKLLDKLFRKPGEIPDNYVWDGDEEYQGWLRFRWGDHGNALDKKEQPSSLNSSDNEKKFIFTTARPLSEEEKLILERDFNDYDFDSDIDEEDFSFLEEIQDKEITKEKRQNLYDKSGW